MECDNCFCFIIDIGTHFCWKWKASPTTSSHKGTLPEPRTFSGRSQVAALLKLHNKKQLCRWSRQKQPKKKRLDFGKCNSRNLSCCKHVKHCWSFSARNVAKVCVVVSQGQYYIRRLTVIASSASASQKRKSLGYITDSHCLCTQISAPTPQRHKRLLHLRCEETNILSISN